MDGITRPTVRTRSRTCPSTDVSSFAFARTPRFWHDVREDAQQPRLREPGAGRCARRSTGASTASGGWHSVVPTTADPATGLYVHGTTRGIDGEARGEGGGRERDRGRGPRARAETRERTRAPEGEVAGRARVRPSCASIIGARSGAAHVAAIGDRESRAHASKPRTSRQGSLRARGRPRGAAWSRSAWSRSRPSWSAPCVTSRLVVPGPGYRGHGPSGHGNMGPALWSLVAKPTDCRRSRPRGGLRAVSDDRVIARASRRSGTRGICEIVACRVFP